jgi:hypothetical protein
MRTLIGGLLIKVGMAILPKDVRSMARNIMLYHVPGALTKAERREVEAAKSAWNKMGGR